MANDDEIMAMDDGMYSGDTTTAAEDMLNSMDTDMDSMSMNSMSTFFNTENSGFTLLFEGVHIKTNADYIAAIIITAIFGAVASWGVHTAKVNNYFAIYCAC